MFTQSLSSQQGVSHICPFLGFDHRILLQSLFTNMLRVDRADTEAARLQDLIESKGSDTATWRPDLPPSVGHLGPSQLIWNSLHALYPLTSFDAGELFNDFCGCPGDRCFRSSVSDRAWWLFHALASNRPHLWLLYPKASQECTQWVWLCLVTKKVQPSGVERYGNAWFWLFAARCELSRYSCRKSTSLATPGFVWDCWMRMAKFHPLRSQMTWLELEDLKMEHALYALHLPEDRLAHANCIRFPGIRYWSEVAANSWCIWGYSL